MRKKYLGPLVILAVVILVILKSIYDYYSAYDYSLRRRAEIAKQNHKDIHVAVVWDLLHEKSFLDGVRLAVNETNRDGIKLVSGRKTTIARLVMHEFNDGTDEDAEDSWLSISANRDIVAVIGHSSSASAIPASISYEYNGVLFISAIATDSALTAPKFKYTFSINPSDPYYAGKLIDYAQKNNLFKLLIFFAQNDYGVEFYNTFVSGLSEVFEIVASRSFFETNEDQAAGNLSSKAGLIYRLMQNDFDAVVLAARGQLGAKMIEQLRAMGVEKPILASEGLDNIAVWDMSHQTANKLYVASVFPEDGETIQNNSIPLLTRSFIVNFKQAYGYEPGYFAFQGYETIKILASSFQLTGSTEPIRVAATLQFGYKNGYNDYTFNRDSLIANKKIVIKEMINGKFKTIDLE